MSANSDAIADVIEGYLLSSDSITQSIEISSNSKKVQRASIRDLIYALNQIDNRSDRDTGTRRMRCKLDG